LKKDGSRKIPEMCKQQKIGQQIILVSWFQGQGKMGKESSGKSWIPGYYKHAKSLPSFLSRFPSINPDLSEFIEALSF